MICIPKNTILFRQLKEKSGLDDVILLAYCGDFVEKYGRFPHLDELPKANSESYLKENLKIRSDNSVKIENILNSRQTDSVEQAVIDINNDHRDLEVRILPIEKDAIVDIVHRPTVHNFNTNKIDVDSNPNNQMVFTSMVNKLSDLYGIKINSVTNSQVINMKLDNESEFLASKAFIKDGQIYINVEKASVDDPLHEMMHILVGSMRFQNPELYQQITQSVENFDNYNDLTKLFPSRSRNDVNEEIFVSEVSKYMTGEPSNIGSFDPNVQYEIVYNINRVLDTVLMGLDSVKTINGDGMYNLSLKDLAEIVNSAIMNNTFKGFINQENSSLHRTLNNLKSELFKNNLLREECD